MLERSICSAAIAVLLCLGVTTTGASADAIPAGVDAAKPAETMDASSVFVYDGKQITEEQSLGLSCIQKPDVNLCFNDEFEAEAADGAKSVMGSLAGKPAQQKEFLQELRSEPAAAQTSGSGGIGVPSTTCDIVYLNEWHGAGFNGTNVKLEIMDAWKNYADPNKAQTSSFHTGRAAAKFNGHENAGGAMYPYAANYCNAVPSLIGTGWDDRFRSRKRF